MKVVDETAHAIGWMAEERMARTSHALEVDGGVWLFDVVDWPGLDDRVRQLGEPAGVVQLLDRHNRDCHAFGVPVHEGWRGLHETPFEALPVRDNRLWREAALWHRATRTLVCADALGTLPFFRAPGERIGWHPFVRPFPPHALSSVSPERILVGHGEGVLAGAEAELVDVAHNGRRRLPRAWGAAIGAVTRRGSS